MKGLVFSEFMDLVEEQYGLAVLQDVLDEAQPASGGAYSAVGNYEHMELISILGALSRRVDTPVRDLLRRFGEILFSTFATKYPIFFVQPKSAFEFLSTVENTVHIEVRKLYENAELPHFDYSYPGPGRMNLIYRSCRPFGDLAEGLILGCARHYGETIEVTRDDLSSSGETHVQFHLKRRE